MKCNECGSDMAWIGDLRSGGMKCQLCQVKEKPKFTIYGGARGGGKATNPWQEDAGPMPEHHPTGWYEDK